MSKFRKGDLVESVFGSAHQGKIGIFLDNYTPKKRPVRDYGLYAGLSGGGVVIPKGDCIVYWQGVGQRVVWKYLIVLLGKKPKYY